MTIFQGVIANVDANSRVYCVDLDLAAYEMSTYDAAGQFPEEVTLDNVEAASTTAGSVAVDTFPQNMGEGMAYEDIFFPWDVENNDAYMILLSSQPVQRSPEIGPIQARNDPIHLQVSTTASSSQGGSRETQTSRNRASHGGSTIPVADTNSSSRSTYKKKHQAEKSQKWNKQEVTVQKIVRAQGPTGFSILEYLTRRYGTPNFHQLHMDAAISLRAAARAFVGLSSHSFTHGKKRVKTCTIEQCMKQEYHCIEWDGR